MKTLCILTLLVLGSVTTYSQNVLTSTIQWNCVSTFDAQNGMMTEETTKVVSTPTEITWYDTNNSVKYSLDITGSEGTWTNVSNNGHVQFRFSSAEKYGVAEFVRENGSIKIIIHFVLEDGKSIYELKVNNVNSI